ATLTEDRNGNANSAYSFNGINNDITIPNTLDALISNEMTVSMWFNMDDNVDHQSLFLRQGSDFTKTWILAMDGTNEIRCYNENGAYSNVTAPTSLYNAWQQLTAVFTDSVISTYINGVLVAEENVGFPLSWSSEPIIL
ncbi:MAG: LamG-like jellyroll fold domain-containing protein, partial [Flavobacteriales bacterium]